MNEVNLKQKLQIRNCLLDKRNVKCFETIKINIELMNIRRVNTD